MSIAMRVCNTRRSEDTAMLCFESLRKLATSRRSAVSTWLYRISYHMAINRHRQLNAVKAIRTTGLLENETRHADEFVEPISEGEDDFTGLKKL